MRPARTQLFLVTLVTSLLIGAALAASCGGGSKKTVNPTPTTPKATQAQATVQNPTSAPKATQAQATVPAGGASVTIKDFAFTANQVTVKVGDTVTWTNAGPSPHTVTADDGSFDSGHLQQGGTYSHTFEAAGTVSYHCSIHTSMTAKVVVEQ